MSAATMWLVKKRASRRRLTFTSPTMNILLLPPTTRVFRSSPPEIKP